MLTLIVSLFGTQSSSYIQLLWGPVPHYLHNPFFLVMWVWNPFCRIFFQVTNLHSNFSPRLQQPMEPGFQRQTLRRGMGWSMLLRKFFIPQLLVTWWRPWGRTQRKDSPRFSKRSNLPVSSGKSQTMPVSSSQLPCFKILFPMTHSCLPTAGPWTIFAPTNQAFSNLPILELTKLVKDKSRLSSFLLNHMVNRSVYSAGLKSHQIISMANGKSVNIFARRGKTYVLK